jgi:hypothetical protein
VSRPQSVLDALADAETLRTVAQEEYDREPRRAARVWRGIVAAGLDTDFYDDWEWRVEDAARRAFRAVPGLREARP